MILQLRSTDTAMVMATVMDMVMAIIRMINHPNGKDGVKGNVY